MLEVTLKKLECSSGAGRGGAGRGGAGLVCMHGKDEEVMYLMFKMKEYRKI